MGVPRQLGSPPPVLTPPAPPAPPLLLLLEKVEAAPPDDPLEVVVVGVLGLHPVAHTSAAQAAGTRTGRRWKVIALVFAEGATPRQS